MDYFKILNWDKFQHYKHRNPPWIKLHKELLRHYEFSCLQDDSKLLLICLWLLASEHDNKIPHDPQWISRQIPFNGDVDLQPLIDYGFIECYQDDSKVIAPCKQNRCAETETETETEKRERERQIHTRTFSLEMFLNHSAIVGLTEQEAKECFEHYSEQGWKYGSGLDIPDVQSALNRWKKNRHKFEDNKSAESFEKQHARVMAKMKRGEL